MSIEFELDSEFIELYKLLKLTQLCQSGGQAKFIIGEGEVLVNGNIETRKRCKIKKGDLVEFDDQSIQVN